MRIGSLLRFYKMRDFCITPWIGGRGRGRGSTPLVVHYSTPNLNELQKPYSGRYIYLLVQKCEENRTAYISVINQAYDGVHYDSEFIVDVIYSVCCFDVKF